VIWRDHIFGAPFGAFWVNKKTNKNNKNINGGEQQLSNTKTKKTPKLFHQSEKNKKKRTGFKFQAE